MGYILCRKKKKKWKGSVTNRPSRKELLTDMLQKRLENKVGASEGLVDRNIDESKQRLCQTRPLRIKSHLKVPETGWQGEDAGTDMLSGGVLFCQGVKDKH